LSNEEIVRVTDKLLQDGELDIECSRILDELASAIPAIAENMERLSREGRDIPFVALVQKEPSECHDANSVKRIFGVSCHVPEKSEESR